MDDPTPSSLRDESYREMKAVAQLFMARERSEHSFQPTDLVHEAWLRLDEQGRGAQGEAQFKSVAAKSMRRVLVDHARKKMAEKRGGDWERVTLNGIPEAPQSQSIDLVLLDRALHGLAEFDERVATVIELSYFGGLKGDDIAALKQVSRDTVVRDLKLGRAWLSREMKRLGAES